METYEPDDWPGGLRCDGCDEPFTPGQQISERFEGLSGDGDLVIVVVVCVPCALRVAVGVGD